MGSKTLTQDGYIVSYDASHAETRQRISSGHSAKHGAPHWKGVCILADCHHRPGAIDVGDVGRGYVPRHPAVIDLAQQPPKSTKSGYNGTAGSAPHRDAMQSNTILLKSA